jgi:hypothetical protein
MEKGAHNVVIVGPGVIKGIQWPLRPGPGFSITSNVKLDTDGAASAIDITYAGDVTIEDVTTDALALARVYADSSRLRKLDFKKHKVFIHGTAKKVVAGFGHVASHKKHPMTVKCNNQSQWVVKQELHSDGGYFSTSGCTMVDLQALMNMYGDEYESRLFPPPPGKMARIVEVGADCNGLCRRIVCCSCARISVGHYTILACTSQITRGVKESEWSIPTCATPCGLR